MRARVRFLAAGLILLSSTHTWAATAEGDLFGGSDMSRVLVRGSTTLYAYSEVLKPNPAGPNKSSTYSVTGLADVSPVPVIAGKKVIIKSGVINTNTATYTPVVGVEKKDKPDIPAEKGSASQQVNSRSYIPPDGGSASATARFFTVKQLVGTSDTVFAIGLLSSPGPDIAAVGGAGAYANDPGFLEPGQYRYDDLTINTTLQIDQPSETAGVSFYALDGRLTDLNTFNDRDEPLEESLWALTLFVDHSPLSKSDVRVEFRVNPLAREMGFLNPAMSDQAIADAVSNSLQFNGGQAQLSDVVLFPEGTTLNVRTQDGEIEYAYATTAGVQAVPEPGMLVLVAIATFGGLAIQRRQSINAPTRL
jgi:hypothetical protein